MPKHLFPLLKTFALCITLGLTLSACSKKEEPAPPQIETLEPEKQTVNTVLLKGKIIRKGTYDIIDYGFIYSNDFFLNETQTKRVSLGSQIREGEFSTELNDVLSNLVNEEKIYVNTYIQYSGGILYGEKKELNLKVSNSTIEPLKARAGDIIHILGKFSARDTSSISIYFSIPNGTSGDANTSMDHVKAKITGIENNKLAVEVPHGIKTSHSQQVNIYLGVGDLFLPLSYDFKILAKIDDIYPRENIAGGKVTFVGENLPEFYFNNMEPIKVYIDDVNLFPGDWDFTTDRFEANIPLGIEAGEHEVSVEIFGKKEKLTNKLTVLSPKIASITPTKGTWFTRIDLYGQNFYNGGLQTIRAVVGGQEREVYINPDGHISFEAPRLKSGIHSVSLKNGKTISTQEFSFNLQESHLDGFVKNGLFPHETLQIKGLFAKDRGYIVYISGVYFSAIAESEKILRIQNEVNPLPVGNHKVVVDFDGKQLTVSENLLVTDPSTTN